MDLNKISSAILNDLWGGNLIPESSRSFISQEQIEDECIETRASIIREWYLKSIIQKHDLTVAINCVAVDCKDQNKCTCKGIENIKEAKHFEIPILMEGIGTDSIDFIGSTDRTESFSIYYNKEAAKYKQYKKRGSHKPYVYIERTPNENNMYDCWLFNAPYVKNISVIGIFKDPRQLSVYNCCSNIDYLDLGSISDEIKRRVLERKVSLYRTPAPLASKIN